MLITGVPRAALLLDLSREELGLVGEGLAARVLRREGWRVLAMRLATPPAEVDLVLGRGDELCCVEVKTGRIPFDGEGHPILLWRPGLRVDARRIARLWRAARFLSMSEKAGPRVDIVEVLVAPRGLRVVVMHHRNVRRPIGVIPGERKF